MQLFPHLFMGYSIYIYIIIMLHTYIYIYIWWLMICRDTCAIVFSLVYGVVPGPRFDKQLVPDVFSSACVMWMRDRDSLDETPSEWHTCMLYALLFDFENVSSIKVAYPYWPSMAMAILVSPGQLGNTRRDLLGMCSTAPAVWSPASSSPQSTSKCKARIETW